MKRNEFLLRLAVENKIAFVSDTVEVIKIPDNSLDIHEKLEYHSTLTSISPTLQSPEHDSRQRNDNDKSVAATNTDDIEQPVIKQSHIDCKEMSTLCEQENVITKNNIELALPLENGNYSYPSSTTTEQSLHLTTAKEICFSKSCHPDLKNQKLPLSESLNKNLSTTSNNNNVNILSDVILKLATTEDITSAQYSSDSTSTVPVEYNVSNCFDSECDHVAMESKNTHFSGSLFSHDGKNITLLTSSVSQQESTENSAHFVTIEENTDGFDMRSVYEKTENRKVTILDNELVKRPSISPLEVDHILPSDAEDEFESSGDEYFPPIDHDDVESSSSDSSFEINIGDIHRTYSKNTKESITEIDVDEKGRTDSKNSLGESSKCYDLKTNELDGKLTMDLESSKKTSSVTNPRYTRKQSARERPTICPLCYEDVITHFPRHLSRHHPTDPEVKKMLSLKPNSKERLELVSAFRKQGNYILKTQKDISHPVRSSKDSNTNYFVCTFCLGLYSKKKLFRHVKACKNRPPDISNPGKNCLSKSQTFMALKNQEFLRTSRLREEVFDTMRADDVSNVAKSDPLICLYGEVLLAKHKRQQIAVLVSSKIREMAKMLMAIRCMHDEIRGLFDILKPEMFATLVAAVKIISGYNENEKSFRAPSLALHMGTNLKIVCNIAFKIVIERKQIPSISWESRDGKKGDIKDLKKLIESHWCNEISSLALKNLKERQWQRPNRLPLSEDILLFKKYIEEISEDAHESLQKGINIQESYKKLTECVLAQTIMFNRKRVGDVQYLKVETYERENSSTNQRAFSESLSDLEKILCVQFKRVITDGKGSKPVPILFSKRTQGYISSLLNIRKTNNIVPGTNPYLFANPGVKNKWIRGDYVIRMLAKRCGAKHPALLTSTKFRKHIATTLQLMNMGADEMEQVAAFMGHTKKTHAQFYRLPQDIYQTAKVVKVLLLLEKGRGKEFRGKNLEEINLDKDYCDSDASAEEDTNESSITLKKRKIRFTEDKYKEMGSQQISRIDENDIEAEEETTKDDRIESIGEQRFKIPKIVEICGNEEENKETDDYKKDLCEIPSENQIKHESRSLLKPIAERSRWTSKEKKLTVDYFRSHIRNRKTPKKHECDQFLLKYGDQMVKKDWVKVKTFVYNTFRIK